MAGLLDGPGRRRVFSALAAIGAVALAIGIVIGGGVPASSKGANAARSSGSSTAIVERRDLFATDTEAGTLGYADTRTVFNRVSGTITWLPAVGSQIKPGATLYQVDGAPVVLFDGTVPAYRTLASGVADGPDVAELKRNLINLGFDPGRAITVNNTFDSATTAAIDSWQASLGETQTGQVTLGQIVFLPGARRVSSVTGVLGSTGGGGSSGAGSSSSSSGGGTTTGASARTGSASTATPVSAPISSRPQTEFVSLTTTTTAPAASNSDTALRKSAATAACPNAPTMTTTTTTSTTTTPTATCPQKTRPKASQGSPTAAQLLAQLVAAFKKLASSSGSSRSASSAAGATSRGGSAGGGSSSGGASASGAGSGSTSSSAGGSGNATQILQTTSADLVVTVQLDATKQSEAVLGAPVTVQLPDGSTDSGKISGVSSVAQSSSSSSSSGGGGAASGTPTATIPVTITLTGNRRVVGLDQAAVSVNFQQQVERGVLSVPVTALLATAGGRYAVQTVQGGRSRLVSVTPGLFAGGYVQVSGPDLVEGMQVSDSQG